MILPNLMYRQCELINNDFSDCGMSLKERRSNVQFANAGNINTTIANVSTGGSRLMRISLLRISLMRFFKTITKIWLMRFYWQFIFLVRT